jgi:hypothetical protein
LAKYRRAAVAPLDEYLLPAYGEVNGHVSGGFAV